MVQNGKSRFFFIFFEKYVIVFCMKWKTVTLNETDSTNLQALSMPIGTVVRADVQTHGKGRFGNKWISPAGNLYMSVVLKTYAEKTPLISFVVALSVAEVLHSKGLDISLKWPNDILLDRAKVGGILLEQHDEKLIVGIGINIVSHPVLDIPYPVTHLGIDISPTVLMDEILTTLNYFLDRFEKQGFLPIYTLYKQYLMGLGCHVRVRLPNQTLEGTFKDFSETGALLLELPNKTIQHVTAGVVFFE